MSVRVVRWKINQISSGAAIIAITMLNEIRLLRTVPASSDTCFIYQYFT